MLKLLHIFIPWQLYSYLLFHICQRMRGNIENDMKRLKCLVHEILAAATRNVIMADTSISAIVTFRN